MKKLFFLFIVPLLFAFAACSDDDNPVVDPGGNEEPNKEPEPELVYVDRKEAAFMENKLIEMYTYTRYRKDKNKWTDYIDSSNRSSPNVNNDTYYYICKNKTMQSGEALFVKYHEETDDYFLSLSPISDQDDYKKGGVVKESPGFIYAESRLGLVPLDEYYSKKNDDIRYYVSKYDVEEMQEAGGDYEYVRTLGYVFPGEDYNVPMTTVRIINNTGGTRQLFLTQVGPQINTGFKTANLVFLSPTSYEYQASICTRLIYVLGNGYYNWIVVPESCGLEIVMDENDKVSLSLIKPQNKE